MKKTLVTVVLTVIAVLGIQAARAWHVHQSGTDPMLGVWGKPLCVGWTDRIGWQSETWSFTRTWWDCAKHMETANDGIVDRYFDPDATATNERLCDVSKSEVALFDEDGIFVKCWVW